MSHAAPEPVEAPVRRPVALPAEPGVVAGSAVVVGQYPRRTWLQRLAHRGGRMTRQSWTAATSGALVVITAMLISFVPVPFVVWSPGSATDLLAAPGGKPVVDVSGLPTYETPGELNLLTVSESSPDSLVSLPEALFAYWAPHRDVLPRWLLYPQGQTNQQQQAEDAAQMDRSQGDAVVAALRAAGEATTPHPMVTSVVTSGPAHDRLLPGDFILKVDNAEVTSPDNVTAAIAKKRIDDRISFLVLRNGLQETIPVSVVGGGTNKRTPTVGIRLETGYSHAAQVTLNVDPAIGGPSGGLMFSLAVYDRITPEKVADGRKIAGTGTINVNGEVGAIGGIHEKAAAAEGRHAEIFLVPEGNCHDLEGLQTSMRIVKVSNLSDAVRSLRLLRDPATAGTVPTC